MINLLARKLASSILRPIHHYASSSASSSSSTLAQRLTVFEPTAERFVLLDALRNNRPTTSATSTPAPAPAHSACWQLQQLQQQQKKFFSSSPSPTTTTSTMYNNDDHTTTTTSTPTEKERSHMVSLAHDIDYIQNIMAELEILEHILSRDVEEHNGQVTNQSIELRGSIKHLMTGQEFLDCLHRVEAEQEHCQGILSTDEHELVLLAREKMNTC